MKMLQASKQASVHGNIMSCLNRDWGTPRSTISVSFPLRVERGRKITTYWRHEPVTFILSRGPLIKHHIINVKAGMAA